METEPGQSLHEVTPPGATVQHQEPLVARQAEQMAQGVSREKSWSLASRCWRLADRLLPFGSRQRSIARTVYKFPSLLLPSNLERIVQYIRMFGIVATYREVSAKVRSDSRAIFDGATPLIPVIHTSHVWPHDELPTEPVTISVVIPVKNAGGDLRPLI